MIEQNNLDKILREKLSGAEITPPSEVWAGIESSLNSSKNRPWLPLIMAIAVLAVLAIGAVFYFQPRSNNSSQEIFKEPLSLQDNQVLTEGMKNPSSTTGILTPVMNNEKSSQNKLPFKSRSENSSHENKPTETATQALNSNSPITGITPGSAGNNRTINFSDKDLGSQDYSDINNLPSGMNKMAIQGKPEKPQSQYPGNTGNNNRKIQAFSLENPLVKAENTSSHRSNFINKSAGIAGISRLPLKREYSALQYLHSRNDKIYGSLPELSIQGLASEYLHEKNLSAFAEARIGIGYGWRKFNLKNELYSQLFQNKINLETAIHNESYTVYVGVLWNKGISASTGIEYFRQWEKYRYVNNYATIDKPLVEYDTTFIGGEMQIVKDTISEVTIGQHTYQHYNKFTSIDIPLIVAYEYPVGNWIFSINGGIFLNILQSAQGQVASLKKTPVEIGNDGVAYSYESRIGLGYYGGLGISYYLKKGWEVGLHPRIRYNPHSLMSEKSVLSERFIQFNISLGLRRYF